jgi:hypothetical protein
LVIVEKIGGITTTTPAPSGYRADFGEAIITAIFPTPVTLMCVDWIFPLKLPTVQSEGQVSEVSPLSQKPFPQVVPGVKEVAVVEIGAQPVRIVPSKVRIVRT